MFLEKVMRLRKCCTLPCFNYKGGGGGGGGG